MTEYLQRVIPPKDLEVLKNTDNNLPSSHPNHRSYIVITGKFKSAIDFQNVDNFFSSRNIILPTTSRYAEAKKIILSGFSKNIPEEEMKIQINKIRHAIIDYVQIKAIIENYTHLRKLPKNLHTAFIKDSIIPNGPSSPGRDFLFEHYVGARFSTAGCLVQQYEPDFICSSNGKKFGVAVKKIKIERLKDRISSAKKQINNSGIPGIIALDLSYDFLNNNEFPLYKSYDEYIEIVHRWMRENFYRKLHQNHQSWNLDGRTIPAIMAFNIGAFLNTETNEWNIVSHLSNFIVTAKNQPTEKENELMATLIDSIQKIRLTLIDSD